MKTRRLINKLLSAVTSASLVLQSFLPLALTAPRYAYAEDVTPTPVVTTAAESPTPPPATPTTEPTQTIAPTTAPTPLPTVTPTVEPIPTAAATIVPNATPEQSPVPTPEATPTVTIEPTLTATPEPTSVATTTQEQTQPTAAPQSTPTEIPNAPTTAPTATVTVSPAPTPEPTPAASVTTDEQGTVNVTFTDTNNPIVQLLGTLSTDKPDYTPTEAAIISGRGFAPGTVYTLVVSSDDAPAVRYETQVTTDEAGNFTHVYQLDGTYRPNYSVKLLSGTTTVANGSFTDTDWPGCSFQCTANDVTVTKLELVDSQGNSIVSCTPTSEITARIRATFNNNSNSERLAIVMLGDLYQDGTKLQTLTTGSVPGVCAGDIIDRGATTTKILDGSFVWKCGTTVTIQNLILSWDTAKNATCSNFFTAPSCGNRTTKCYAGNTFTVVGPLVADFSAADVCEGNPVFFTDKTTGGKPAYTYAWNFDDGGSSTLQNPTHDYTTPNAYSVTQTVTDSLGTTDLQTRSVNVWGKPTAAFSAGASTCPAMQVAFTNTSAAGTNGSPTMTYAWNFGDGTTDTVTSPTHTYTAPGTYTVTLTATDGHTCAATETKQVTVSPCNGTLSVKKVVKNDNGGTLTAKDFSFSVNGATATAFETDGQNDLSLPAGTYSVTETPPTGYAVSYDNCSNVVLAAGGSATCTVTNDDIAPTLTVNKLFTPVTDTGSVNLAIDGTVYASGVGHNGTTGAVPLTAGKHAVTETAAGSTDLTDYEATFGGACDSSGNVTLALGDAKTCTITNARLPKLTVVKTVTTDNGGTAVVSDFTLSVGKSTVTSGTTNTFPPGTYTVTESGPAGYTATYGDACDASGNVTLTYGDTKTCTINNNDQPATLTVIKTVVNDNGGSSNPSDFTMTIGGVTATGGNSFAGSATGTVKTVTPGSYSVSESGRLDIPKHNPLTARASSPSASPRPARSRTTTTRHTSPWLKR